MEIANIDKTANGIEYAYEQEGKFDTKFIANCIENGDEFCCEFYAPITYSREQLKSIGQDMALVYGGECINIERVVRTHANGSVDVIEIV